MAAVWVFILASVGSIEEQRESLMTRYPIVWVIVAMLGLYTASPAAAKSDNVVATDILDGVIPLTGLAVAHFKDDTEGQTVAAKHQREPGTHVGALAHIQRNQPGGTPQRRPAR